MTGKYRVWQRLGWVFLYAVAMGLLEAICVIYLRRLILPVGATVAQLGAPVTRWPVEIVREVCTVAMLVAVAWLAGFNWRSRAAYFFFMFGAWDILYYVGLKWLGGWPSSWLEWDCLFLIPKPWYAPVLAPVLISAYFMVVSGWLIVNEDRNAAWRWNACGTVCQVLAAVIWYWSFVKDADLIRVRGYHGINYSWGLFGAGMVIGLVGIWLGYSISHPERRD